MPSGKTHDTITLYCLPIIFFSSLILSRNIFLTVIITAGFLFSGLMFGPDLDIYSVQYKRWKWLRFLWLPYQKTLKHRSLFSHGFLIGTMIRIVYVLLITGLISILLIGISQAIWGFDWNWHDFLINLSQEIKNNFLKESISLFIGLELGAMSHYFADNLNSFFKSRLRFNQNSKISKSKNKNRKKKIKKGKR